VLHTQVEDLRMRASAIDDVAAKAARTQVTSVLTACHCRTVCSHGHSTVDAACWLAIPAPWDTRQSGRGARQADAVGRSP